VGVERLSGLAGRVLGGRDADVVWSWLLGRMPLSAVKNAVWRALHKAEQTTSDFYGLLAPPFEELRKRAQSLRTLSDAQLMCWDASPVGGREWMQIIILDAIITQARARAPAAVTAHVEAADPPTHACPICCRDVDAAASRVSTFARVRARGLQPPLPSPSPSYLCARYTLRRGQTRRAL